MTPPGSIVAGAGAFLRRFGKDARGANAIEFALLALPFIGMLLFIVQMGLLEMTKTALDTGVVVEAEALRNAFATGTTPVLPSGSALKAGVAAASNGFLTNGSQLKVEVQPLANLDSGAVAISDQLASFGSAETVLALRASYQSTWFLPGMNSTVVVHSSALVRRQNQ
jgi:Flp pilus assembly protein TadG